MAAKSCIEEEEELGFFLLKLIDESRSRRAPSCSRRARSNRTDRPFQPLPGAANQEPRAARQLPKCLHISIFFFLFIFFFLTLLVPA
jgi:hypothetical protein